MPETEKTFAKGTGFERKAVYYPKSRPGFTSWVCLWPVACRQNEYMLSFVEMRRGNNPVFRKVPLDFFDSMGLPYKYQITLCNGEKDIISENVILHSKDNGSTWTEIGRSCDSAGQAIGFTYESLPDGSILRAISNAYNTFTKNEEQSLILQRSSDDGNTWKHHSTVLSGFFHFPHRLRKLKDGTMVLASPYTESFGPWAVKKYRNVLRSEVLVDVHMSVYISKDEGFNWSGPLSMFQGYNIAECEFVELPSGDLLFIESGIFSPPGVPPLRQFLYRTAYGYIPGPVMKSFFGPAPETAVLRPDGILVGALRNQTYSCSKDLGRTWHHIKEIPFSCYQPMIRQLEDGRLITAWHQGADNMFGETDQFIGTDIFSLEEDLPPVVSLTLERDMDGSKKTFVNAFTADLLCEGKPLPGRQIMFSVSHRGTEAFKDSDPRKNGVKTFAETNEYGKAKICLDEYDKTRDIHAAYRIAADFVPDGCDIGNGIYRTESDANIYYGMSHSIGEENAYPIFYAQGKLFVSESIIKDFPFLNDFVEKFRTGTDFTVSDVSTACGIDENRVSDLLDMLCSGYILVKDDDRCKWKHPLYAEGNKHICAVNTNDYLI